VEELVSATTAEVREGICRPSRTLGDPESFDTKVRGVVEHFWRTFKGTAQGTRKSEDKERFAAHATYIRTHRAQLVARVPERLKGAVGKILDKMLKYDGRLAAKAIYHGKVQICANRNWRLIREKLGLIELAAYEKETPERRGKCKQWGFKAILGDETDRKGQHD
jgi:hypothetical protein